MIPELGMDDISLSAASRNVIDSVIDLNGYGSQYPRVRSVHTRVQNGLDVAAI